MTERVGGDDAGNGTPLEQVQAMAETVETWARQVREVDDEPKVHVLSIERGVSELFTVGDLFDILAMALRGVESDLSDFGGQR